MKFEIKMFDMKKKLNSKLKTSTLTRFPCIWKRNLNYDAFWVISKENATFTRKCVFFTEITTYFYPMTSQHSQWHDANHSPTEYPEKRLNERKLRDFKQINVRCIKIVADAMVPLVKQVHKVVPRICVWRSIRRAMKPDACFQSSVWPFVTWLLWPFWPPELSAVALEDSKKKTNQF